MRSSAPLASDSRMLQLSETPCRARSNNYSSNNRNSTRERAMGAVCGAVGWREDTSFYRVVTEQSSSSRRAGRALHFLLMARAAHGKAIRLDTAAHWRMRTFNVFPAAHAEKGRARRMRTQSHRGQYRVLPRPAVGAASKAQVRHPGCRRSGFCSFAFRLFRSVLLRLAPFSPWFLLVCYLLLTNPLP